MNKELIDQAARALNIQDVCLRNSRVFLDEDFDPILSGWDVLGVQFRQHVIESLVVNVTDEAGNSSKMLRVLYECAFRLIPQEGSETKDPTKDFGEDDAPKTLAMSIARFAAYYQITDELEKDAIDEFAKFNVGYHVWPYWREYASSIAARFKLPTFMVPLYRIPS